MFLQVEHGEQERVHRTLDGDPMTIQTGNLVLIRPSRSQVPSEGLEALLEQPWVGRVIYAPDNETQKTMVAWLYSSNQQLSG